MPEFEELPLPEPQEQVAWHGEPKKSEEDSQYEVEIVDDTPEADRGKAPPAQPTEQIAGSEADDEGFAPDAKKRIKQLRYVYHEERRGKEQAKREADAAVEYAKRLIGENTQLKEQLSTGERVLVEQAKFRAEAQVSSARQKYLAAHEAGDAPGMAAAQEEMARAVSDHQRFTNYVPSTPPQQAQPQSPQQPYAPQPQPDAPDPRTASWLQKQAGWFRQPGWEEQTNFALGVHQKLISRGVGPTGPDNGDEYWSTIESRLAAVFPEQFGSVFGKNGHAVNGASNPPSGRNQDRPSQPAQRPVVATGGARKSSGPVKVRLTQSQATLARRLGLSLEQYAKQVAKEQKAAG